MATMLETILLETGALTFAWPWAVLILPLPVIIYMVSRSTASTLYFPALFLYENAGESTPKRVTKPPAKLWAWLAIWALLTLALMRPELPGQIIEQPREGRNIMLAVDISASMRERDMVLNNARVDRLTMVQAVVDDFVAKRKGDKIGLILFGSQAFLQSPLTYDLATVQTFLREAVIGLAGRQTAIGDAMGIAAKHMQHIEGEHVLILLTDGENTAGTTTPLRALTYAEQMGLKIYTIGVGRRAFGQRSFNPRLLETIARRTGGQYFAASDPATLAAVYAEIDTLERSEDDAPALRIAEPLLHYPLAAALALIALLLGLSTARTYRTTRKKL